MHVSKNPLAELSFKVYKQILESKKIIFISIGLIVLLTTLIFGYIFYKNGLQFKAYKSLHKTVKLFSIPVKSELDKESVAGKKFFTTEQEKWDTIAKEFEKEFKNNSGSNLAPVFLFYQAEALINLGKSIEAVDVMKKAVKMLPISALKSNYNIKLALLMIDTGKSDLVDQGIKLLKEMALDKKDFANDQALYRVGEYYWYKENFAETKNYWNQLILQYGREKEKYVSVWAQKAKEKLKLIQ